MKNQIIFIITFLLISCGASKYIPVTPSQTDVDRTQSKFTSITLEDLNLGKTHYEAQCGNCHKLKNPTRFTDQKWRSIVPRMAEKANKKAKNEVVDATKQEQILKYVVAMSSVK